MIIAPEERKDHAASAWMAGIAVGMLLAGVYGATQPLLPHVDAPPGRFDRGIEAALEQFDPPTVASDEKAPETLPVEQPDIEIPPLPVIMPPLAPPEMVELTPLETLPPPKAKAQVKPERAIPLQSNPGGRTAGASGPSATLSGGGSGRFPSPAYPAAARANREQGTVNILVTVEANGLPSSVVIQSSSGSATLDNAAQDHISRRWRWPAGEVRHFIVPVRFVLQP